MLVAQKHSGRARSQGFFLATASGAGSVQRMWRVNLLGVACVLILAPVAMGQVARPAPVPSADDALKAYREGRLAVFATSVNDQLKRELSEKKPADDAIVRPGDAPLFRRPLRHHPARLACRRCDIAMADQAADARPASAHRVSPRDNPAQCPHSPDRAAPKYGKSVEEFADLAVATCVVWDSPAARTRHPIRPIKLLAMSSVTSHRIASRYATIPRRFRGRC